MGRSLCGRTSGTGHEHYNATTGSIDHVRTAQAISYGLAMVSASASIDRVGRAGCVPSPSPLRTVRAVLPHTALRSVVLPQRGLTDIRQAATVENNPGLLRRPAGPLTPPEGGRQHALRPDRRIGPCPRGAGHSSGLSHQGTGHWFVSVPSAWRWRIHLPAPFRSAGIAPRQRCNGCSDSCAALLTAQVSLLHVHGLPDHSVPNHPVCSRRRFHTLPLSATGLPATACAAREVQASPLASRLARHTRPKRVRHPTDWSFTSCCFPPRLAAAQLQSVTGRRAHA